MNTRLSKTKTNKCIFSSVRSSRTTVSTLLLLPTLFSSIPPFKKKIKAATDIQEHPTAPRHPAPQIHRLSQNHSPPPPSVTPADNTMLHKYTTFLTTMTFYCTGRPLCSITEPFCCTTRPPCYTTSSLYCMTRPSCCTTRAPCCTASLPALKQSTLLHIHPSQPRKLITLEGLGLSHCSCKTVGLTSLT